MQTHKLIYHARGYAVADCRTNRVVFSCLAKSEAIAKAQEWNGWIIDGDEQSYARQARGEVEANNG